MAFHVANLASFCPKEREQILARVSKIERKNFPSSEVFDFDAELKKKNTNMFLAIERDDMSGLAGYLVFTRVKKLALLHKICVIEEMRGKGVGKSLIHSLRLLLEKGGCYCIQLWVDEARSPARALYQASGFQQCGRCVDYYGPGRTGLKMELHIE
jgi:ribosomal protein S18 acetylase RimI-like enzyme